MAGFIGRWKKKLFAPKVPVVRISKRGHAVEFMGYLERRDNSLLERWQNKGYEIRSDPTEITINGRSEMGYVVDEAGVTVAFNRNIKILLPPSLEDIFEGKIPTPAQDPVTVDYAFEGIIGRASAADDINEAMDLGKSMKNTLIGVVFGIPIGWIITVAMR